MPGLTPQVGDLVQVRVHCKAGSQAGINVLNYRVVAVVGGGMALPDIASYFDGIVPGPYTDWMSIHSNYEGVEVQNLQPPITNPVTASVNAGAGVTPGANSPRQVSGLIGTHTVLGGRPNRGRIYVPFPASTWVSLDGELTGAGLAALQAVADALGPVVVANLGAVQTSLELQVRHPDVVGPPRTPVSTAVIRLTASTGLATQRRRGDFGQPNPSF